MWEGFGGLNWWDSRGVRGGGRVMCEGETFPAWTVGGGGGGGGISPVSVQTAPKSGI